MSRSFNEELQTSGALYERLKSASHSRTADGGGRTGLCDFPTTAFFHLGEWGANCYLQFTWILSSQQIQRVFLQLGFRIELLFNHFKKCKIAIWLTF